MVKRPIEEMKDLISSNFQDIIIDRVELIESGWTSNILLVNGNTIFRFPKIRIAEIKLLKEFELLSILGDCPTQVPRYEYKHTSEHPFGGYPYIPGIPIQSLPKISNGIIHDLSTILKYLKSKTKETDKLNLLQIYDEITWKEYYNSIIEKFKQSVGAIIGDKTFEKLKFAMDAVFRNLKMYDIGLIHGDLSRENVLVSNDGNTVKGILDWADSCVGDINLDIAASIDDFEFQNLKSLQETVFGISGEFKVDFQRVIFYRSCSPLFNLHFLSRTESEDVLKIEGEQFVKRFDHRFMELERITENL